MTRTELSKWEQKFRTKVGKIAAVDPGHDLTHVERVVRTAMVLATSVGAQLEIVIPAAWLHDLVSVEKSTGARALASTSSAGAAAAFLTENGYPTELIADVQHAIMAHSFSAGISPQTIEAKVVQDADRLDALGAIGIARCFATGAKWNQKFYDPEDPFAQRRSTDDHQYTLDHFKAKIFKIVDTLHTPKARIEGQRRAKFMWKYLREFGREIGTQMSRSAEESYSDQ